MSLTFLSQSYFLESDPESLGDGDDDEEEEETSGAQAQGMEEMKDAELKEVNKVLKYLLDEVEAQNGKEKLVAVVRGYPVRKDTEEGGGGGELEASPPIEGDVGDEIEIAATDGAQIEEITPSSSSSNDLSDVLRRRRNRFENWMRSFRKRQRELGRHKLGKTFDGRRTTTTNPGTGTSKTLNENRKPTVKSPFVRKAEAFKCPFCLDAFPGRNELIEHLKTHEDAEETVAIVPRPNPITTRGRETKAPRKPSAEDSTEMKTTTPASPAQRECDPTVENECGPCGFRFRDEWSLQRHMKLHSDVGRPWKCSECSCFFAKEMHLRHHESKRHGKQALSKSNGAGNRRTQRRKCPICNLVLLSWDSSLKQHMRLHEATDRKWKCSRCPSFFQRVNSLGKHESQAHGILGERKKPCRVCGQVMQPGSFARHNKIHTETNRPWKCTRCPSFFQASHKLRVHETEVHGRKPGKTEMACEVCGKLLSLYNLAKHMETHKPGRDKPWKCSLCPSFFAKASNLRRHEKEIHRKNLGAFQCPLCRKRFSRRDGAAQHLRNVHGYKKNPYADIIAIESQRGCESGRRECAAPSWKTLLSRLKPCKLVLARCDDHSVANDMEKYSHSQSIDNADWGEGNQSKGGVASEWEEENDDQTESEEESPDSFSYANELRADNGMGFRVIGSECSDDDGSKTEDEEQATACTPSTPKGESKLRKVRKRHGNWIRSNRKRPLCQPGLQNQKEVTHSRTLSLGRSQVSETKIATLLSARKVELFKCPFCSDTFPGTNGLIKHLEEAHTHKDATPQQIKIDIPPNPPKLVEETQAIRSIPQHMRKPSLLPGNANSRRHKCHQCGLRLRHQYGLQRHMKLHSGMGRPWKCSLCGCFFAEQKHLLHHESQRHGLRPSDSHCPICNVKLDRKGSLNRETHMKIHPETNRKWKCSMCLSFFLQRNSLRRHEAQLHGIILAPIVQTKGSCKLCGKVMLSNNLDRHMRNVHGQNYAIQPCKLVLDRCDHLLPKYAKKTASPKTDVQHEHQREQGKSKNKPLGRHTRSGSKMNAKSSPAKTKPEAKISSPPSPPQRVYICPYCFESFPEAGLLIGHLPTHTTGKDAKPSRDKTPIIIDKIDTNGLSPKNNSLKQAKTDMERFQCAQCSFSSPAEAKLQNHMKLHSKQGRPFQCPQCRCRFPTFASLRSHEGHFHKGSKQSAPQVHKCQQCNHTSQNFSLLKIHMMFHVEEGRPFKCPQCQYTFGTAKGLQLHEIKIHKSSSKTSDSDDLASSKLHKRRQCIYYSTGSSQDWQKHVAGHKSKKEVKKPFKCLKCDSTFQNFEELMTHAREQHKEGIPTRGSSE